VPLSEVLRASPRRAAATAQKDAILKQDLPLVQEEPLQRSRSRVDLPSVLAADSKLPSDATIVDIPMDVHDAPSVDSVEVLSAEATLIDVSLDSVPEPETPIEEVPTRPSDKISPRVEVADNRDTRAEVPAVGEARRPARRVRLPSSETRVSREVVSVDVDIQREIIARKAEVAAQAEKRSRSRMRLPSSEATRLAAETKGAEEVPRPARVRLPSSEATRIAAEASKSQSKQRPRREPTSEVRRDANPPAVNPPAANPPAATSPAATAKAPAEAKRPAKPQSQSQPARLPVPTPTQPPAEAGGDRSVQEMFLDYLVKGDDD
jgi:hypothetical protein